MSTDQPSEPSPELQDTPFRLPMTDGYYSRALQQMQASQKRPKNPLSAFCLFSQKRRAELKAENPDVLQKKLLVQIKKEWKQLEDKSSFTAQAKEDYEDYKRLMSLWELQYKSLPVEPREKLNSALDQRLTEAPEALRHSSPSRDGPDAQEEVIEEQAPRQGFEEKENLKKSNLRAQESVADFHESHHIGCDQIPEHPSSKVQLSEPSSQEEARSRPQSCSAKRDPAIPASRGVGSIRFASYKPSRFQDQADNESSRSIWTTSDEIAEQEEAVKQQLLLLSPKVSSSRKREAKAKEKLTYARPLSPSSVSMKKLCVEDCRIRNHLELIRGMEDNMGGDQALPQPKRSREEEDEEEIIRWPRTTSLTATDLPQYPRQQFKFEANKKEENSISQANPNKSTEEALVPESPPPGTSALRRAGDVSNSRAQGSLASQAKKEKVLVVSRWDYRGSPSFPQKKKP